MCAAPELVEAQGRVFSTHLIAYKKEASLTLIQWS